jgi:hypothetical protein
MYVAPKLWDSTTELGMSLLVRQEFHTPYTNNAINSEEDDDLLCKAQTNVANTNESEMVKMSVVL